MPATLASVLFVTHNLRPECRRDIEATAGEVDFEQLAVDRYNVSGHKWAFHDAAGVPYAIVGLEEDRPGVRSWWMLTTAVVEKHALNVARFGRNAVMSLLATGECHRIQAFVLADWPQACRLAETIGLHREATMRRCGIQQEDIVIFAATHERTIQA